MRRIFSTVILLGTLLVPCVQAAIAPATVWEVWPGSSGTHGDDTNGGGFSIGVGTGTAYTTGAIDATTATKFCDATHGTFASDAMKYLKITAGTGGTVGFYQIVSVTTNGCSTGVSSANLDRSAGTLGSTSLSWTLYPGIDRTQQSAAQTVIDNSAITATCSTNTVTFTGSTYTPTAADIGNVVQLISDTGGSGTFTAGFYEITAENTTTWSVTGAANACGTTNTITSAKMGGSLNTLGGFSGAVVNNRAWVKTTGILTPSATTTFSLANAPTDLLPVFRIYGYTSTRGDNGVVTIQPTSAGLTIWTVSGNSYDIRNFFLDGSQSSNTIGTCITTSGNNQKFVNVECGNWTTAGLTVTAGSNLSVTDSYFLNGQSGCTAAINLTASSTSSFQVLRNTFYNNSCTNITPGSEFGILIAWNLMYGSAQTCINASTGTSIINNTIDGCTVAIAGTANSSGRTPFFVRNNLISNGTTGLELFTVAGWAASSQWDGNCYYNNTNNRVNSDDEGIVNPQNSYPSRASLDVLLSSSPYVDDTHASGNYAIKNTSGAYQGGTPGPLPGVSQLGYMSCGALTPQAPSGATGAVISNSYFSNSSVGK